MPTPLALDSTTIRVFFASRHRNRPSIWFTDVQWFAESQEIQVLGPAIGPALSPGPIGSWSQDGVYPSSILTLGQRRLLFIIGWEVGAQSSLFRSSIGVVDLNAENLPSPEPPGAPLLDRSLEDPFLVTSPTLRSQEDGQLHMIYVSGDGWARGDEGLESRYSLRQAWSRDGQTWDRRGTVALPLVDDLTHVGRTCFRGDAPDHLITCVTTTARPTYQLHWGTRQGESWELGPPLRFQTGSGKIESYPALVGLGEDVLMFGNLKDRGASGFSVAVPASG